MLTVYQDIGFSFPNFSLLMLPSIAVFLTQPKVFPRLWVIIGFLLGGVLSLFHFPIPAVMSMIFIPTLPIAFRHSRLAGFSTTALFLAFPVILTFWFAKDGNTITVDDSTVVIRNGRTGKLIKTNLALESGHDLSDNTLWLKTDDEIGVHPLYFDGFTIYWGPEGLMTGQEVLSEIHDRILARNQTARATP